jgi:two-component system chemotaxis response regulator CheB
MQPHSLIVVGGSAGSMEPLITLAGCLPDDLPAAVLVAIHTAPEARSHLPEILSRAGLLEARHPVDGESIEAGRIYVAPPDHHLIVGPGHLHLSRGPRENGHRPAVDPMFRSAARSFGNRVTGVVLSGAADDGAAGLVSIKSRGGVTVAQDPRGALHPSMPESAIATGVVDTILSPVGLGPFLVKQAGRALGESAGRGPMPVDAADLASDDPRLQPTGYACPECSGGLFQVGDGELTRFRCRIGHAYSPKSLEAEQSKSVETALWTAVRALEERADFLSGLSERLRQRGGERSAERMASQAAHARSGADQIKDFLSRGSLTVLGHDPSGRAWSQEPAGVMRGVGSGAELQVDAEEQQRPQDYGQTG